VRKLGQAHNAWRFLIVNDDGISFPNVLLPLFDKGRRGTDIEISAGTASMHAMSPEELLDQSLDLSEVSRHDV
jgi:hypothetical protein